MPTSRGSGTPDGVIPDVTHQPSPLLGCAIADALGKPFENYIQPLQPGDLVWDGVTMCSGGPQPLDTRIDGATASLLNQPGVSTDDTQMSRILAGSLVRNRGYNPEDALRSYLAWFNGTSFVGKPRGMGGTIARALAKANHENDWMKCGVDVDPARICGTGTAMRAGILGMLPLDPSSVYNDRMLTAAVDDALITHRHADAAGCSVAMAAAVHYTMQHPGMPHKEYSSGLPRYIYQCLARRGMGHGSTAWAMRSVDSWLGTAHAEDPQFIRDLELGLDVVSIVAEVILSVSLATSYEQGVVMAIRMGGDTDTRGAMVGTILGVRFGLAGIPTQWVQDVYESNKIQEEDLALVRFSRTGSKMR